MSRIRGKDTRPELAVRRLLHAMGFVRRRKEGLFVYYALADKSTFQLCDIMCGRLEAEMKARRRLLTG